MTSTAIAVLGALGTAHSASAAPTPVAGGAVGIEAHVNALVVPLDVGPLPAVTLPAGGSDPLTASLVNTNVLGLVTIKTASVSTSGKADPGTVDSAATVADLDVAGLVTATVASSTCSATSTGASGSAKVVDLVVAGIPIVGLDLGPNTTISLPVGTVTLNEQTSTAPAKALSTKSRAKRRLRRTSRAAGAYGITVNAVHVHLNVLGLVTGDVVLGQSRCSVG